MEPFNVWLHSPDMVTVKCSFILMYCWFSWVMVTEYNSTKNEHIHTRGESTSLQACWKGMLLATWKMPSHPAPNPRPFNNYYRCFGLGVKEEQFHWWFRRGGYTTHQAHLDSQGFKKTHTERLYLLTTWTFYLYLQNSRSRHQRSVQRTW